MNVATTRHQHISVFERERKKGGKVGKRRDKGGKGGVEIKRGGRTSMRTYHLATTTGM